MQILISAIVAAVVSVGSFFGLNAQPKEVPLSPPVQRAIQKYVDESMQQPTFGTTLPIAGQTYNLYGSGLSQTGTSITLASFTVTQTGQKIQDSDLSDTFYITLEPGNPAKQEIVSCTTVVQNANGSATLSGCTRGLSPITPYTASSTLRFSHGGGTQVIFSNPPQFYNGFAILDNTNTFTGTNTFNTSPFVVTGCSVTSDNLQLCNKSYIDGVAVAGASNANDTTKGIVEMATANEASIGASFGSTGARLTLGANLATSSPYIAGTYIPVTSSNGTLSNLFQATSSSNFYKWDSTQLFTGSTTWTGLSALTFAATSTFTATSTFATSTKEIGIKTIYNHVAGMTFTATTPQAVTFGTTTGTVYLVDGDNASTTDFQGFALTSGSTGSLVQVQTAGIVTGFSGLTPGSRYYVQDTGSGGAIGTSVGTAEIYVGFALTTTDLMIDRPMGMQYLGNQSITCASTQRDTLINQPLARFAIISGSVVSSGGNNNTAEITIAKVGKTSGSLSLEENTAGTVQQSTMSTTWTSTSSIRVTAASANGFSSCSVTAYYYR